MTTASKTFTGEVPASQFSTVPRLLIRASAGTGKTFQLSNRYLSLLRRCAPDRILAVTFTRKAAGEILDRILTRLSDAVLDDGERSKLSGFLGGPPLTATECNALLETIVRQLHRVKVGTLDGFFSRLASSIPLEIGIPPNWAIADEHAARALSFRAIDTVLRRSSEATTRRLVRMLAKGDVPRSVTRLMSTAVQTHFDIFRMSEAAAWRCIEPPAMLATEELELALVQCEQLDLGKLASFPKTRDADLKRFRGSEWESFLKNGLAVKIHAGESMFSRKEIPEEVAVVYRRLLGHVRGLLLKIWADQMAAVHELLTEYSAARRELQAESQELRFDDVALALATRMSSIDARALVHRLDADVDHLLLDEFQDTSLLQWDVLRPFVQALDAKPDASFFCVGDVKQAIYGWRGGVAALFDKVECEVPGLSSGMLNESRRSAGAVISVVNNVFQNLTKHPNLGNELRDDVECWQTAFPEHSTALADAPGYVVLQTGDTTATDAASKQRDCCAKAADIAEKLVRENPALTIGILTRKNEMVGRVIHELAGRNIQASEEGGVRLTTSAAVQLIQSLLQFADHPGDTTSLFHIANSPLADLFDLSSKMSATAAHAVASLIRTELAARGYESAIERWSKALRPVCSERDWARVRRLCTLAAAYDPVAGLRPAEFANRIDDERVEEATASAVRVMTIHKSKGLEFDIVILPDLDWLIHDAPDVNVGSPAPAERPDLVLIHRNATVSSLLPPELRRAIDQQRRTDVQESLCCLYVAMTRAAHALYLVIASQPAKQDGTTTYQKTAAGLLRAALVDRPDVPPSTKLFEFGDAHWHIDSTARSEAPLERSPRKLPSQIPLARRENGRIRGREAVSPSQKKSASVVSATSVLSTAAVAGLNRGTLWHLWCQHITWTDDAPIDKNRLLSVGRPCCRDEEQLAAECEAFLSAIAAKSIRRIFSQRDVRVSWEVLAADVEIKCINEYRFSILDGGQCLTGSIDRLILLSKGGRVVGAEVVDFKTDLAGQSTPLRESYREQVRLYAGAICRSYQLDEASVRRSLVWLATDVVEAVPHRSL